MKTILVLFDSLNRRHLPPYGGTVHAPNFTRLAERSATFDTSYVCSMPCMPARRDIHTGRPNFLHRAWSPLEPFDDSMPRLLSEGGVYSHLISDHYHYWEEGGSNYHTKYSSWEIVRGQEGDPWTPQVTPLPHPDAEFVSDDPMRIKDVANRLEMPEAHQQPMSRVFSHARRFIERNVNEDNWFLQVETFDPHEPFFTHRRYKDLNAEHYKNYKGKEFDWPPYREVRESPEAVEHVRAEYAALVSMCDEKLGDLLDMMDRHQMWDDTMLIVATDHGYLLGEHDCWAKCWMPFYEEVARTPLFVWDPRCKVQNERRKSLVQPSIDLAPTILRFFGMQPTERMTGHDLAPVVANDATIRDSAIFGIYGGHVNIADGRYVYMRGVPDGAANEPLYEYTLMPANMRQSFPPARFQEPFEVTQLPFSKGCHVMKIKSNHGMPGGEKLVERKFNTRLYDLQSDPRQEHPIDDPAIEARLLALLDKEMKAVDAPAEQWQRLGM